MDCSIAQNVARLKQRGSSKPWLTAAAGAAAAGAPGAAAAAAPPAADGKREVRGNR